MGLEGVEIILNIEETFKISIADAEAQKVVTVAGLCHLVLGKAQQGTGTGCLTSRMFYRVRRSLIHLFGHERAAIRIDARLSDLIPLDHRAQHWQRFGADLGLILPELQRPRWLENLIFIPALTFGLLALLSFTLPTGWPLPATLFGLAVLFPAVVTRLTRNRKVFVPTSADRISDLVSLLPGLNPSLTNEASWGVIDSDVCQIVKSIIANQTGLPIAKITDNASLVDDLGID